MQITGKPQQAMNYRNNLDSWIKKIWMIPAEWILTYLRKQLAKRMNMEFTVSGYEHWHFHLQSVWPWKNDLASVGHTFLNFILDIVIPAGHSVAQMRSHMSKQFKICKMTLKCQFITFSLPVFHMILSDITFALTRGSVS